MANVTLSTLAFELGCDGVAQVQKTNLDIYALCLRECSNWQLSEATLPSSEVDVSASAGVCAPAHIKAIDTIESEAEYHAQFVGK